MQNSTKVFEIPGSFGPIDEGTI